MSQTTIYGTAQTGYIRSAFTGTWAGAHDASTGTAVINIDDIFVGDRRDAGGNFGIRRGHVIFDLSVISAGDVVTAITYALYVFIATDQDNDAQAYINVVAFTPADPTSIMDDDFDQYGTTKLCDTDEDITSISTGAYLSFVGNTAGIVLAGDAVGGYLSVGFREGHDIEDIATVLGSSQASRIYAYDESTTGTSQDPKIILTHTSPTSQFFSVF